MAKAITRLLCQFMVCLSTVGTTSDVWGQAIGVTAGQSAQDALPPRITVDRPEGGWSPPGKLPRVNFGPVPIELVRPIGVPLVDQPVWDKLQTEQISIEARDTPIADIVAHIRRITGLNVYIDRPALEEEGITVDTPVSANIHEARLDHALGRLLRPLNLTFTVKHGVLAITSMLQAGNELTVRVYPVADLVWVSGEHGADSIDADSLIQVIEQTITPNSWSMVGGAGSIRFFTPNLSLAVLQTTEVHELIARLLVMLRQARAQDGMVPHGDSGAPPAQPIATEQSQRSKLGMRSLVIGVEAGARKVRTTLSEIRGDINFRETPLIDVVRFLEGLTKLDIDVDRVSLEEEGISEDTPVSMDFHNLPLDDALDLFLGQYNLAWTVRNDVLVITSRIEAENELCARCYPAPDLVTVIDGVERWSINEDELVELISITTVPNSWSTVGGAGTIEYFPHSQSLVINQTQAAHDRVAELLAMLRESSDRLSGIGSSIQVRLPVRVNQMRLQAARDRQAQAEVENRKTDSILAQSQKRFEEETAHPELGRQRVELQLLKAQIQQQREMHQVQIDKMKAETSALKAQAILAERRAKQLETASSSDGPKATEPN